jgi:hypothetical protein
MRRPSGTWTEGVATVRVGAGAVVGRVGGALTAARAERRVEGAGLATAGLATAELRALTVAATGTAGGAARPAELSLGKPAVAGSTRSALRRARRLMGATADDGDGATAGDDDGTTGAALTRG